jgi:hypothetical protein
MNTSPSNFPFYSAFGKSLCTYKSYCRWYPRASIQAWTRLILFANTFCRSAFGKSLRTYKKELEVMSTSVYTGLNPFNFIRKHFLQICVPKESLYTYTRCWKWCPRASIQSWTRLILFANSFCRSAFGKSLCTYKTCWKWCPWASIQALYIYIL